MEQTRPVWRKSLYSADKRQLDKMATRTRHPSATSRPIQPDSLPYGRACHPSVWDGQVRVGLGTLGNTSPLI